MDSELGLWNLGSFESRILEGFEAIAKEVEEMGWGNALVVSRSWTILRP